MDVEDIEEADFGMVNYDEDDTCPVAAEFEGEASQKTDSKLESAEFTVDDAAIKENFQEVSENGEERV